MLNYSKDFLEQVTKDHPYFSVAQFCLLKKTAPAAESFAQQAARSAIFFNNPHWLNFQLHQATTGKEDTSTIPLPDLTADETISINEEVDRIYLQSTADCVITDASLKRRIRIAKRGSHSTVVWNPWADKARQMGDLGVDGHLHMLCVESANAADDVVKVAANSSCRLQVSYSVEKL